MFSVMSFNSHCFIVMVVLVCTAGNGRDWDMHEVNRWTVTMAPQLWYGVPLTKVVGMNW